MSFNPNMSSSNNIEGAGLKMLKIRYKNDVELEYHVNQIKAVMSEEANKEIHKYHVDSLYGIHHWEDKRKDFYKNEMGTKTTHKVYSDKKIITVVSVDVKKK
ncbi:hypothetical protein Tco_0138123 [Tanacetum coccineum]